MEAELEKVLRLLAEQRWPFRIHATYDESIGRMLDAIERVHRDIPLTGLHWLIDHAETISARNIDRVKAAGGGIAIQHRMAFQGEYFVRRYGAKAAEESPPIRRILAAGVPLGAGTDATRVASYNPFVSLYWLVTGRTVGGTRLYGEANRLDRREALGLWTEGSSWFSTEDGKKGALAPGQLADFAVLSEPYFEIPEERIKHLESVLTAVSGRPVYAAAEFRDLDPGAPPILPDWSPVKYYGGYPPPRADAAEVACNAHVHRPGCGHEHARVPHFDAGGWPFACGCFAF
jgi:hypothetical protein